MESFEETRRQLRFSLIALAVILPVGVAGYILIEGVSVLDALWITITTLTTVGYGDVVARSELGRMFTLVLIVFGLGAFAFAAQATIQIFVSPAIRDIRLRRKAERKILAMRNHYVICGEGELVDKLITYVIKRAELRRNDQREARTSAVRYQLQPLFGVASRGIRSRIRDGLAGLIVNFQMWLDQGQTILDVVVVVTRSLEYANHLRDEGLLVIQDDPTDDRVLRRAGILHARAVMSMLDNDTETLLNVLTIRSRNPHVYIAAATHANMGLKMIRVGANNVIAPYDVAGQFLNNATLRPAVNAYFNSILFDQRASSQIVHLVVNDGSPWIGQRLADVDLRNRFETGVIGLRTEDGNFVYAPPEDHVLREEEVLLLVTPGPLIPVLYKACRGSDAFRGPELPSWQRLPAQPQIKTGSTTFSLSEAETDIKGLRQHYILCGSGPVLKSALDKLDPARPFVVLTDDHTLGSEMLKRGFRVIMGEPTDEDVLRKAGVERALAIMISIEEKAGDVLVTLNSRTLNRKLLIVAAAHSDDMIPKLRRAGADRVMNPFRIAAQFMLLATTRPIVTDFMQHVIFNYEAGIETTELYMQDDSSWIGERLSHLQLETSYHAGVIGIRQVSGRFIYDPPDDYIIQPHEVLIVIVPMAYSDELRHLAHGSRMRPDTLRMNDSFI